MAIINGTANGETLTGTAGDDTLHGLGGNDVLDGGLGDDRMEGGTGDDRYVVDSYLDQVIESAGEGYDTVETSFGGHTLAANVERLIFTGTTSVFSGTGNALDNWIEGGIHGDYLDGKGGADTMVGHGGNDTYYVDTLADVVVEQAGGGDRDTVYTTLNVYTLGAELEQLYFKGTGNFQGYGNALDNLLEGWSGDDFLSGGAGADRMYGFSGNDTYVVDHEGDDVSETIGSGYDTVYVSIAAYALKDGLDKLVYTGSAKGDFRGNGLANHIEGGAANDRIDGGAGADTMVGKGGSDDYQADDAGDLVVEEVGGGLDTVYARSNSYALPANVENLVFGVYHTDGVHGVGNALNNYIVGSGGNDLLDGGAGHDFLSGGYGDDTFIIDAAEDSASELDNQGYDTAVVSNIASFALAANVERLVFDGATAFTAYGNAAANHLRTGSGNDLLIGGAGADTMEGRGGNDTYSVDDAGDVVTEAADEGYDTVNTALSSHTLAANVEKLVYTPQMVGDFTGIGNASANTIVASAGNDWLDGGAGADTLQGKAGNDIYIVDDIGDVVIEDYGQGADEVRTSAGSRHDYSKMFVLAAHVENLTGTSPVGQGVFANWLDNVVTMGGGGDLIVMQDGGNDVVSAGGGDDFIHYGNALTAADSNDGGAGYDTLGLLGSYTLTFGAASLVSIEKLAVYSAGGGNAPAHHYNLATVDANVAAGGNLMVVGLSLNAAEALSFDGSAETDGSFNVRGGKGADTITGGAKGDQIYGNLGADSLRGGGGKDSFEYSIVAESNALGHDHILDFAAGDKINLWGIDADGNAANGNSKFAFIGTVAFGNVAGRLRVSSLNGMWHVEGDTNGDGAADLSIFVTTQNGYVPSAAVFVL